MRRVAGCDRAHPDPGFRACIRTGNLWTSRLHRRGPCGAVNAMNIVVCVKYVPDATADRHFEADNTVDRVGVDGLLSELDEYAVEQALQLKEKRRGRRRSTVTALTVGPEQATDAIRKALQMGADKGVHVVDDAIAGSDSLATSLVLAAAIEKIGGTRRRGDVRHGLDRRRRWASSRRCWPSASASRRSPWARWSRSQGDEVRIKRDGDTATEVIGGDRCRWCCR